MTEPDAPTPTPAAKKAQQSSVYLVLKSQAAGWVEVSQATARTTEKAIEDVVGKLAEPDQAGVYVAVVASRWQPVAIESKVERSLVIKAVH